MEQIFPLSGGQKITKIILIIAAFSIIAFLGYIGGGVVKYNIDVRKADKAVERFQGSLEQPYKDDIYGGKTPEETWAMFLAALKKGDINLASKYAAVNKQTELKKDLEKSKVENKLDDWIKEMDGLRKSKNQPLNEKEEIYYSYDFFSKEYQQILTERVIFYLNPYTKVWKIVLW